MSFELSEIFSKTNLSVGEMVHDITNLIMNDKIDVAKKIINTPCFTAEMASEVLYQCGWNNQDALKSSLYLKGARAQDYLDGSLIGVIDQSSFTSKAIEDIAVLMEKGANLYCRDHVALQSPLENDELKMCNHLIQLGVDPRISYNDAEMQRLSMDMNETYMSRTAFAWLIEAREEFAEIHDTGVVKDPAQLGLQKKDFSPTIT